MAKCKASMGLVVKGLINLRIIHFILLQFVNAVLNECPTSDITNEQCTGELTQIRSFLNCPVLAGSLHACSLYGWPAGLQPGQAETVTVVQPVDNPSDSHSVYSFAGAGGKGPGVHLC